MTPLFKKLNYKNPFPIVCLNAPASFKPELKAMSAHASVATHTDELDTLPFVMSFVLTAAEIEEILQNLGPKLQPDTVLWFCYPKKSSKRYTTSINRDQGWEAMATYELEPVRQVAIDEDWSALRFKPVDQIKTMTRRKSMTLTEKGQQKTKASPK